MRQPKNKPAQPIINPRHFEQGALTAQMGLSDKELWSTDMKAGYDAFKAGQHLIFRLPGTPAMLRSTQIEY